jgi:hypothetical protein
MSIENSRHPMKLDQGEQAFFKRELEYVKVQSYDTKQKQLKGLSIIPISTEAGNGVTEIIYRRYTAVGYAKIIADYAHDFPRVDIYGEEVAAKVKGIGDSYGYNIKEIRMSQTSGKRLDQRRALAARRANDEKVNKISLVGDISAGLYGVLNFPGITEYTVPADGTGSSKLWSAKTVDLILRDINGLVNAVVVTTNGIEQPETLLLPLTQYNYISTTRLSSSASDTTIKEFILKTSPYIKRIDYLIELNGFGAGGTQRMMVGCFDNQHITLEIPQPFEQFDADQEGMEFVIPCHSETAGVLIYYPLAFAFADGI